MQMLKVYVWTISFTSNIGDVGMISPTSSVGVGINVVMTEIQKAIGWMEVSLIMAV